MRRLRGSRSMVVAAALVGTAAVAVLPTQTADAASKTYTNACRNSAVPTNWDQITTTLAATSPVGPTGAGATVTLSGIRLTMSVPGSVFVAGYNLGLLTVGINHVTSTFHAVIDAANTVQHSQATGSADSSLTTTITDPDGLPGTGDETATLASGSVNLPNQTWTAGTSGTIAFAEHNDTAIKGSSGGGVIAVAHLGLLNVQFHCTAGSVTNGGNPAPPAVVKFASAPTVTTTAITDRTPPTIVATAPTTPFTLATSTILRWVASDALSGIAGYQAQFIRSAWNSGFGVWTTPASWANLPPTTTSVALGLALGYNYCLHVRARDKAGNWSGWTATRCVARPLDDRAQAVNTIWSRRTGSAYWNSTITLTNRLNAVAIRTGAQLDRVGIVATRGVGMGVVGVYVGSVLIGKINLAATATAYRSLFVLPRFSLRAGTVTVKVLTSGKTVQLDGLAVSRS